MNTILNPPSTPDPSRRPRKYLMRSSKVCSMPITAGIEVYWKRLQIPCVYFFLLPNSYWTNNEDTNWTDFLPNQIKNLNVLYGIF